MSVPNNTRTLAVSQTRHAVVEGAQDRTARQKQFVDGQSDLFLQTVQGITQDVLIMLALPRGRISAAPRPSVRPSVRPVCLQFSRSRQAVETTNLVEP